jgi:hypothetical protein
MKTKDGHTLKSLDELIWVCSYNGSVHYCQNIPASSGAATGKYWYLHKESCQKEVDDQNGKNNK